MSKQHRLEVRLLGAGHVRAEGVLAVVGTLILFCVLLFLVFRAL
jgi:hypothetical protein